MSKASDVLTILESEDQFSFSKLVQDALANNFYAGYVFIKFREGNKHDAVKSEYTLNGKGDSWFRKLEDHPWGTKGFGLAIKSFKITSRTPQVHGHFNVYKGSITYIPNDDEDVTETGSIWLWVHKDYELQDVLDYVNKHKGSWKP